MSWQDVLKQMTDGQRAFLDYMVKHHSKEYAMDMGIQGMNPSEVFYLLQEEMNVNNYEKDADTEQMYNDMDKEIENIMSKHYKSFYDMR